MKHPPHLLFHAEDEAAPEKTTPNTKTIWCVRARRRRKGGLTFAALPGGSFMPGNYASRARPSTPDGPHTPKRKTIGSDREAENSSREKQ
jgi:hypothetical protein